MRKIFLSTAGFFLIAITQFSLINVAFSNSWIRPDILILATLLWMLRREFFSAMSFAIILGLVFDIIANHALGITSLFLLWCVYGTSFVSRRFLVEHSEVGILTTGLLAGLFSWGHLWIDAIYMTWQSAGALSLRVWFLGQDFRAMFLGMLLNGSLCILALLLQRRFWRPSLSVVPKPISTRP